MLHRMAYTYQLLDIFPIRFLELIGGYREHLPVSFLCTLIKTLKELRTCHSPSVSRDVYIPVRETIAVSHFSRIPLFNCRRGNWRGFSRYCGDLFLHRLDGQLRGARSGRQRGDTAEQDTHFGTMAGQDSKAQATRAIAPQSGRFPQCFRQNPRLGEGR